MKWKLAAGIFAIAISPLVLADSTIQQAQEALKEQGYYYGQISGEKNADTTAAIRRFQIRNGLQVTGELNEETLRTLNANSSARTETATPPPQTRSYTQEPQQSDEFRGQAPQPVPPLNPRATSPRADELYPVVPPQGAQDVFGDTPYQSAPPQLQRQVLLRVQSSLRRRGLYRGALDGVFGPELEFALRTYQSRVGLPPSGRLDMETLASLGMLPGQRPPGRFVPAVPPVRGEWVR